MKMTATDKNVYENCLDGGKPLGKREVKGPKRLSRSIWPNEAHRDAQLAGDAETRDGSHRAVHPVRDRSDGSHYIPSTN